MKRCCETGAACQRGAVSWQQVLARRVARQGFAPADQNRFGIAQQVEQRIGHVIGIDLVAGEKELMRAFEWACDILLDNIVDSWHCVEAWTMGLAARAMKQA